MENDRVSDELRRIW